MEQKHIICLSGGKDSTAMLLMMIEKGMKIDDILFCDTGVEFPEMYAHLKKLQDYIGREITVLKAEHDFEYYLLHKVKTRGAHKGQVGYGFPNINVGGKIKW